VARAAVEVSAYRDKALREVEEVVVGRPVAVVAVLVHPEIMVAAFLDLVEVEEALVVLDYLIL